MDLTDEYLELKSKIDRKKTLIAKHSAELKQLLAKCTHEELASKELYYEGNYNDRAYTDHWQQCNLCGKRFNETTKTHSWYG